MYFHSVLLDWSQTAPQHGLGVCTTTIETDARVVSGQEASFGSLSDQMVWEVQSQGSS